MRDGRMLIEEKWLVHAGKSLFEVRLVGFTETGPPQAEMADG